MFMNFPRKLGLATLATLAVAIPGAALAQDTVVKQSGLLVTTSAEIERRSNENGHPAVRLLPADHVVPGDLLIYTVEARNAGPTVVVQPTITLAVPEHMRYVAGSAVAPGAEVSFSVNGGRDFDKPDNLFLPGPDGTPHRAGESEYTHIRWVLKNSLKANSIAYARFRATLK